MLPASIRLHRQDFAVPPQCMLQQITCPAARRIPLPPDTCKNSTDRTEGAFCVNRKTPRPPAVSPEASVTAPGERQAEPVGKRAMPVVGIGASAGGLEALNGLFGHMPADTGMAFVVVQHLDPQHESRLR